MPWGVEEIRVLGEREIQARCTRCMEDDDAVPRMEDDDAVPLMEDDDAVPV